MAEYWLEAPPVLQEFLNYHESILSHSSKTVDEYFLDLRNFFRYLKRLWDPSLRDLELDFRGSSNQRVLDRDAIEALRPVEA